MSADIGHGIISARCLGSRDLPRARRSCTEAPLAVGLWRSSPRMTRQARAPGSATFHVEHPGPSAGQPADLQNQRTHHGYCFNYVRSPETSAPREPAFLRQVLGLLSHAWSRRRVAAMGEPPVTTLDPPSILAQASAAAGGRVCMRLRWTCSQEHAAAPATAVRRDETRAQPSAGEGRHVPRGTLTGHGCGQLPAGGRHLTRRGRPITLCNPGRVA
jgi:hypothetical protein